MTFQNPDTTFFAQAERVMSLYQQLADIRDAQAVGDTDSRRVSLNNVMMAANASMAVLRLLHWAKNGGEQTLGTALQLSKPEYINFVAEDMLRSSRLFLLVETQFQLEALFRNILAALGRPPSKQGFYNVAKDVLEAVAAPDPEAKIRILNVPALMRNSMHANGIHHGWNGSSTVETIKGVEFRFEHGKPVQCGSWYHVVTALSASAEVVSEIVDSPAVRRLDAVSNSYAQQRADAGL